MTRLRSFELDEPPTRPAGVDDRSVATVLRVPPESGGMRLDRFVMSQLRKTSRTRAQAIVRASAYLFDGHRLRPSMRVRAEQLIVLWRPPWDEKQEVDSLDILYEDDDLLVVDKPPFVPVHPTARYFKNTVVKLLESQRDGRRAHLAHRIDRETSGVLLLTQNSAADRHVKLQFSGLDPLTSKPTARRFVEKIYLALVHGHPTEDNFVTEYPLEPDSDNPLRVKMRVAEPGSGLTARTVCKVQERRVRPHTGERYALVACELLSGRQHQIRVHLATFGFPLVGDKLYGDDDRLHARGADGELTEEDIKKLELTRHALHAHRLELDHPQTSERVRFESPLPEDLSTFWDDLLPV